MHRVVVLDQHGTVAERLYDGPDARRASLTYITVLLRRRSAHLQWIEGDELPGLPAKVLAERMGNPCEETCCVPLAAPWPEQQHPVTNPLQGSRERGKGHA